MLLLLALLPFAGGQRYVAYTLLVVTLLMEYGFGTSERSSEPGWVGCWA